MPPSPLPPLRPNRPLPRLRHGSLTRPNALTAPATAASDRPPAASAVDSATNARLTVEHELRRRPAPLLRWLVAPLAACALAVFASVAGRRQGRGSAAPSSPITQVPVDGDTHARIAELERKLDTMGQLVVATSLLQQQQRPVDDRLSSVLTSANTASAQPSEAVIHELISAAARRALALY